jgi:hypothetical protein
MISIFTIRTLALHLHAASNFLCYLLNICGTIIIWMDALILVFHMEFMYDISFAMKMQKWGVSIKIWGP